MWNPYRYGIQFPNKLYFLFLFLSTLIPNPFSIRTPPRGRRPTGLEEPSPPSSARGHHPGTCVGPTLRTGNNWPMTISYDSIKTWQSEHVFQLVRFLVTQYVYWVQIHTWHGVHRVRMCVCVRAYIYTSRVCLVSWPCSAHALAMQTLIYLVTCLGPKACPR